MKRHTVKPADRPVDEPLPMPIATKPYKRNPIFDGLCPLCGRETRGLYCYGHRDFEGKR